MTVVTTPRVRARPAPALLQHVNLARLLLQTFLVVMAAVWLFPLLWALYEALRPISDTTKRGYFSLPGQPLTFANFVTAWDQANLPHYYLNTLLVAIPGVVVTLLLASLLAFTITKFSWKLNLAVLMLFTAGNLLPPQVIIIPLYWVYLKTPMPHFLSDNGLLYDQYIGIIFIHIVFQLGFATFVLSNYMKTLPKELTESALVDGAGLLRIWANVIMPLCRPALAAMATLLFTFIYNDFFWALLLMKSGSKRPIVSALNNLQGEYFTNYNLLAAGALLAAIPSILIFLAFQKHFVRGLTLGATKG
ncbi:MAG: carbohydrate ABC transporter permease [Thermorudis peleae]|mgnify:CR=1 FL=1|nr:carbohydrate ABC transporter permease [Thermorudis peleae]